MQGGNGIRISGTATPGGSITINVGPSDDTVEIGIAGDSQATSHLIPGNKDTSVPIPNAPPGTIIVVRIGRGKRLRRMLVTIVSPAP